MTTRADFASAVEWPSAWRTVPLWTLFERIKDVGHPDEEMLSVYRNYGVVKKDGRGDNFNKTAENRDIYQLVDEGWLVVNRMKAWQGSVGISSYRGIVSGHYICFRPKHEEDPRFLNWLLRSDVYALEYMRLSRGVRPSQIEIDNDGLRVLPVRLPGIDEQRRIADFLDTELVHIDRLATCMQAQNDLLAARRSAVLMRASGENGTPSVRLGYFLKLTTSGPRGWGEYASEHGTFFFRSANLRRDSIDPNLDSVSYVAPPESAEVEAKRSRVEYGDVLIGLTGANAGWVTYADSIVSGANVSQHVCLMRPVGGIRGRWLAYYLASPPVQDELFSSQYGGTKTQLSLPNLRDLRVPVLPPSEQDRITSEIDAELGKIEGEQTLRARQLELLTERCQALITAAVTGEFDVSTASGRGIDVS
ncbi:restriction endonuclease subunit S [Sphaerisporangium sp. NPDC049003]|uniref:restriction endonuclease subunit S n=1 Tax=Sphaerisporangium sp. NPDC049003 TaxID=3364517 RepID=UPI0037221832